ncbi:hypothetical protein D3C59_37105 [Streptomyces sp. SHP22-7]|nr:hypothetical protein D3C59_37105 [Streptomyces sp. SHP22-7]
MSQCSRLTKAGKSCGRHSVFWQGVTALADPKACHNHLSGDERAVLAAHREAEQAAWADALALDPSCWSWPWPIPDGPDWERLLVWHHGRCAICGAAADLLQDHDHRTGLVRGYLCTGCNTREAHYGDAALLREVPPASPAVILGVSIRYVHPVTGQPARPMLESPASCGRTPPPTASAL